MTAAVVVRDSPAVILPSISKEGAAISSEVVLQNPTITQWRPIRRRAKHVR